MRKVRRSNCARTPLTPDEIRALDGALTAAFQSISRLREKVPVAKHVKFPPLPSVFSESIIIGAAPRIFGDGWKGEFGGVRCDVLLQHSLHGIRYVEVKATGEHAFQELKAKDLKADLLAWIHFGKRFQRGRGKIVLWLLEKPRRHISEPCRLDIVRFKRRVGPSKDFRTLEFDSLDELLGHSD